MTAIMLRGLPVAAAFAGFVFAQIVQGATADSGPFAKVPAFPTACYSANEPFFDKVAAAREAVIADREKQTAINAKIEKDFNGMDMMEKSQRMQQWMMDNPQEAMKFAQASQAVGQQATTVVPELSNQSMQFDRDRDDLMKRYDAAMKQAQAPADARMAVLDKKLDPVGCHFGSTECEIPKWALDEMDAIQRMRDAAYQAACPPWWAANGQVQAFFKRKRDWVVTKYLPAYAKNDELMMQQYAIMNTPAASYKSTLPHDQAVKYLDDVYKLYNMRETQPICTAKGCGR